MNIPWFTCFLLGVVLLLGSVLALALAVAIVAAWWGLSLRWKLGSISIAAGAIWIATLIGEFVCHHV